MAAKKATRKKTASRKAPVKAKAVTRKNPTPFKKRAAAKPKRAASKRRRSNPSLTAGLGSTAQTALTTVLAMTGLGLVSPLVPQVLGPSPVGRAGQIGGLGWLGGYALKRFGFSKAGEAVQLGGAVLGASILIEAYVAPAIRGALRPAPAPAPAKQMNGFYVLPQSSGTSLPPAPFAAKQVVPLGNKNGAGVQGMMVVPR